MNATLLYSLWQSLWLERVGWTLLHFLWQGTLAAAVLAALLAGLHRAPARNRYLVSVLGAAAACLFPPLTFLLLPLPAGPPAAGLRREMARPPVARALVQGLPPLAVPLPLPAATAPANSLVPRQPVQGKSIPGFRRVYHTVADWARPLLPWCAALWAAGVAVLSLRLLAGWTQVQRLRRQGTMPADGRWQARLEGLARRLGVRRAVRLLESTLAEVPAVIGWLRPVVLVPVGVLAGLSTAQVEMILAHELAHVRRQDYLVNLGLTLFETFGFYHPAVWWIARCVRAEREHACDDLAVSACGGDRVGYVRALATLEEMRGPAGQFALAASGGGRGLLLARVRRLLGVTPERRPRTGRATWWLAGATALAVTGVLILGALQRPARAQEPDATPVDRASQQPFDGQVHDAQGKPVPLYNADSSPTGSANGGNAAPAPASSSVPVAPALPYTLAVTPEIKRAFAEGDGIEIRAITGTTAHFQVGGTYRITGVCRQQSLAHATLYVGNTAEPGSAAIAPAAGSSLDTTLPRGSTQFNCTFQLLRPGVLHATVYDLDNHDKDDNAYAGVYLGKVVQAEDPPPP